MEGKSTAFCEFRRDRHLTAVKKRQMLYDRESEPGATHISGSGSVNSIKPLKQTLQMLGGNSVTIVMDEDLVARS